MRKSLLLICLLAALAMHCSAQEVVEAAIPRNTITKPAAKEHRFFDRANLSLTAMTFSAALADGITTQHALGQHRTSTSLVNGVPTQYAVSYVERNPIAAPLVNRGWPGQLAATALTAGADLGIRNWLHRSGHHRMERVVPFLFAATSASFAAHNAKYW